MSTATNETPDLNQALGDETTCIAKMRQMFRNADMLPAFPMSTERVVELLRENGFDVSITILENWIRSGMVPNVRLRSGQFTWAAQNVLAAAIHADTWKRWIPLHPKFIHRLSAVELAEAQAGKAGETAFTDLDTFDIQAFTVMLERCDDPQLRHVLAVALRTKLKQAGLDK